MQPTGASEFNEVFLSEVRIPVANVIGEINGGWARGAHGAVERVGVHRERRRPAGRMRSSSLLAGRYGGLDDPTVRQTLATTYTRECLLRVMGDRILAAVRRREAPPMDPSILKLFIAENRVQSAATWRWQLAGPTGIATDDEISQWIQARAASAASAISIGGGTNEVQRNNLAERALGLPKEMRNDHELAWKDIPRS